MKRQQSLPLFALFFLLSTILLGLRAEAATYTVKPSGGNYTTIQSCATAMAAGDTCVVYAGTYNEVVTVSAGTAGSYKTVQANSGDTVNVYGFSIGSHTKVIGFNITRPSSPNSNACVAISSRATDFYITNNTMYACGGIRTPTDGTGVTYGYIQGNTMSYMCSTSAAPNTCVGMYLDGGYFLIENNDMSHMSDGITLYAHHTVFRNNNGHDFLGSECGSNSSNCHIDFIESEPGPPTTPPSRYNLYEGNTLLRNIGGGNNHTWLTQGDACGGQCYNTIIRFNVAAHLGSATGGGAGLLDQLGGYTKVKTYNNTYACVGTNLEGTDGFGDNSTGGSVINNIYYYCTSVTIDPYAVYGGSQTGFVGKYNLGYCTATPCGLSAGGTFLSDPGNKVNVNPLFVNPGADDYHLQSTSPAINAGSYLTTASAAGTNSTSLAVADASFFQDGWTIPGVQADWIRIGASTTVKIASINYSTNAITLANPVSWSSGDAVYLYKDSSGNIVLNGANPDIGAFPSGTPRSAQPPSPPTNVAAVVQ